MSSFENKLVAVLNEKIESGVIMNALAHMCLGLSAKLDTNLLHFTDYEDKSGRNHPWISKMPFMILKAYSNKIREARNQAELQSIHFVDFLETMTGGTYEEQLAKSKNMAFEELTFYGIVLFGPWDAVSNITKKFSLWK